jgi:hypothetical protein
VTEEKTMKPEDFADNDPYLIIAADSHADE